MEEDEDPLSRYYGRNVYLPDVAVVRAGDILLTFNAESDDLKGAKASRAIRSASPGRFSHALICSSPPTFVEAIGTGVSALSLANCFAHDLANVRVLRYPDEAVAARAAGIAQLEIGRDYSVARAVRSVFPLRVLDRVEDHGVFCSALVAQAYIAAGSEAFARTPADRTTPATIERMAALTDITASVFRTALPPNNILTMSALDGDRAPTLSAGQTEISRQCAMLLFDDAQEIALAHPEAGLEPIPTFYGLLDFVIDAIVAVLRVPEVDRVRYVDSVSAFDTALAAFVQRGDLKALIDEVAKLDDAMLEDNVKESFSARPAIDETAMRSLLEARRAEVVKRWKAIEHWERRGASSRAMKAYLDIDRTTARHLAGCNEVMAEILERLARVRRGQ